MIRIKELREENHITQENLAKKLKLSSKGIISMYEKGDRKPSLEILIKLSEIFNCSIDYILGKSDIRNPKSPFKEDELHIALSQEDKGYISEDVKNSIQNYAKYIIEQEKKKQNNK